MFKHTYTCSACHKQEWLDRKQYCLYCKICDELMQYGGKVQTVDVDISEHYQWQEDNEIIKGLEVENRKLKAVSFAWNEKYNDLKKFHRNIRGMIESRVI